ncbi:MAG TPA: 30S ribosomal protein S2 [Candidatus Paceibacterota bacterium]|nr:30S ribosomal protein S2 [Candidatus Paceibacterota bacterium]
MSENNSNGIGIKLPEYEEMVKAGMHFGRKKSIFNPKMKPFVYTLRDSICIIDLVKTRQYLFAAIAWLRQVLAEGKLVLFVGLSEQSSGLVEDLAGSLNMPYVTHRWLGGTLTNFKTVISRVQHLETLEKKMAAGEFDKFTKKERLLKEREIIALKQRFDGLRKLTRVPDVIFVASLKDSELAIREAKAMKVKVAGIVNTESNPQQIDFPIPANDNARRSIELIIGAIKSSLENSK